MVEYNCKDKNNCEYIKQLEVQLDTMSKELECSRNENDLLRIQIKELKSELFSRKRRKKETEDKKTKQKKKKGAPKGHPGWFRKVPQTIDEVVDVYPEECPECGNKDLNDIEKLEEHTQEDIIFPKKKVTKYIHHFKYCSICKKVIGSKEGEDELLNSYIGPNAKSLSVYFKYNIKMSDRDIQKTLKLFGISVDPSSIPGFRNQLTRKGINTYNYLLEQIRQSPYVNADETGWRLDGDNHWLWNLSNKKISVNHIDKSRGRKVLFKLLGEDYGGVVIADFLSVYDKYKNIQRCITHLLREIKKIIELYRDDESVQLYCKRLKDIFYKAMDLKKKHFENNLYSFKEYLSKCNEVENLLDDLQFLNPMKGKLLRIGNRLKKYKKQLFTFLYHKDVPYHNNHAEQQIRPNVLMRKITFGNRSQSGVTNHNVLMSLIQTGKLNNHNILDLLKYAFVSRSKDELINHILPP